MEFVWHTVLNLLDMGSSLVYYLLGRDLSDEDLKVIAEVFSYFTKQDFGSNKQLIFTADATNNNPRQAETNRVLCLINSLKKGKDLLLVTNQSNSQNLVQAAIFNLFTCIQAEKSHILELDKIFKCYLKILNALFLYGCDPNRGLYLTDLKPTASIVENNKPVKNQNKSHHHHHHHHNHRHHNHQSNGKLTKNSSLQYINSLISDSSVTLQQQSNNNSNNNMATVSVPFDLALLLVCCIYNCHNIANLNDEQLTSSTTSTINSNKSSKSHNKSFGNMSNNSRINNNKKKVIIQRMHSFPMNNNNNNQRLAEKVKKTAALYSSPSSSNGDGSLDHGLSLSRTLSNSESKQVSIEEEDEEEIMSSDAYSSLSSSHTTVLKDITSTTTTTTPAMFHYKPFHNLINEEEEEEDESPPTSLPLPLSPPPLDDYNDEEDEEEEVEEEEEEEEEDDEVKNINNSSSDDDESEGSNIYEYEEEQAYFEKYEYDINSKCFQENFVVADRRNSLTDSLLSLPSSTFCLPAARRNHRHNFSSSHQQRITKSQQLFEAARQRRESKLLYETLNRNRLELVDLLLLYGADKYANCLLTNDTLKLLNRKSANMLLMLAAKPMSPIMASLCFDDVDIFSRLYADHHMLFDYFKPDECYELIYYAVKFQSKNCLVYLLKSVREHNHLHPTPSCSLNHNLLSKNTSLMFYILENTRSPHIVDILIKCGFDLCKRESSTGNTALHCLFDTSSLNTNRLLAIKLQSNNNTAATTVLDEFSTPHCLYKILFVLLKYGSLKVHVNTLNQEGKLCMQMLFEWDELVNMVFFGTNKQTEWQNEFNECLHLLIKSGAHIPHSYLLALFDTILKHSIGERDDEHSKMKCCRQISECSSSSCGNNNNGQQYSMSTTPRSMTISSSLSPMLSQQSQQSDLLIEKKKNFQLWHSKPNQVYFKAIDLHFLHHLLNDVIDLRHLKKSRTTVNNSILEKYLELLLQVYSADLEMAFRLLMLICEYEQQSWSPRIDSLIIKRFITNLVLAPNFLCSNKQLDKSVFVKRLLGYLIVNRFVDVNEFSDNHPFVNNEQQQPQPMMTTLLHHCVSLIPLSKSCYQLELVYDLLITLVNNGANVNADSFKSATSCKCKHKAITQSNSPTKCLFHIQKRSMCLLAKVCDLVDTDRINTINLHRRYSLQVPTQQQKLFNINNNKSPPVISNISSNEFLSPSYSYASLLTPVSNNQQFKINNRRRCFVDNSLILVGYYKRFVKLFYELMDEQVVLDYLISQKCMKFNSNCNCHINSSDDRLGCGCNNQPLINSPSSSVETLDAYLEQLVKSPRSLKSISRRSILKTFHHHHHQQQPKSKSSSTSSLNAAIEPQASEKSQLLLVQRVYQLPLPENIIDYLLFND